MQGLVEKEGENQSPRLGAVLVVDVVGDGIAERTGVADAVDCDDDGHVDILAVDPVVGWGSAGASHPHLCSDPRHCRFHYYCCYCFGC